MNIKSFIRVKHVAYTDIEGGAARAAFRVHKSLIKFQRTLKINSSMRVIKKFSIEESVQGGNPKNRNLKFFNQKIFNKFSRIIYRSNNPNYYSTAWPSTGLGKELNQDYKEKKFDVLNLHWLGDRTLSIKEIGNLKMPLTWRLADQWPMCGCEHYAENLNNIEDEKFIKGYDSNPDKKYFIDLNRFIWKQKIKFWKKKNINIIAPTNWIAECAKKSVLFNKSLITIIPTPVDLVKWSPINKLKARKILGLPPCKKILLFGAFGGPSDLRKGGDLLIKALNLIETNQFLNFTNDIELVVFGKSDNYEEITNNIKLTKTGIIKDDKLLRLYYSAADVFILPSRQDNLPGTGLEAQACGTPVVAFDCCGMPDIIKHRITGSLAKPYEPISLINEINWVLEDEKRLRRLSIASRKSAEDKWSPEKISYLFNNHYLKIIEDFKK